MEIGRKIYFNKTTGEILCDTGERMGNVEITTIEQDFSIYPNLINQNFNDVNYIQLEYGERAEEFKSIGSMSINPISKELTIYPRLSLMADKLQINSDGSDIANITSDYGEYFTVNDGEKITGSSIQFASNVSGEYTIKAYSTYNGTNSIVIEVV